MEKSQKRAIRRHRSYSKWMSRLKRDWNGHGWTRGLDGRFDCDCFYLNHPQALRFKDTPKSCSCIGCGNPRTWYKGRHTMELSRQELTVEIGDRENWQKRKRRDGDRLVKLRCRCGVMIGKVKVPFHEGLARSVMKQVGFNGRCENCRTR